MARKGKQFDHIMKSGRMHMTGAVPAQMVREFRDDSTGKEGRQFDHILESGRTRMMGAVPVRLGWEFCDDSTGKESSSIAS